VKTKREEDNISDIIKQMHEKEKEKEFKKLDPFIIEEYVIESPVFSKEDCNYLLQLFAKEYNIELDKIIESLYNDTNGYIGILNLFARVLQENLKNKRKITLED